MAREAHVLAPWVAFFITAVPTAILLLAFLPHAPLELALAAGFSVTLGLVVYFAWLARVSVAALRVSYARERNLERDFVSVREDVQKRVGSELLGTLEANRSVIHDLEVTKDQLTERVRRLETALAEEARKGQSLQNELATTKVRLAEAVKFGPRRPNVPPDSGRVTVTEAGGATEIDARPSFTTRLVKRRVSVLGAARYQIEVSNTTESVIPGLKVEASWVARAGNQDYAWDSSVPGGQSFVFRSKGIDPGGTFVIDLGSRPPPGAAGVRIEISIVGPADVITPLAPRFLWM